MNGEVNVSKLRPVNIEDLLGREEINVNMDEIMDYVSQQNDSCNRWRRLYRK